MEQSNMVTAHSTQKIDSEFITPYAHDEDREKYQDYLLSEEDDYTPEKE